MNEQAHQSTPGIGRFLVRLTAALALMIGLSVSFIGTASAQDPTEEDASVRVIHASPGSPEIDVIVDGAVVVEALAFGMASEYQPLSPGEHQVQITPTGQGAEAAVIEETIDLDDGESYIIAAVGLLNEIETEVYEVNDDDIDDNQARVRVIHASEDIGNVDVYVTGGDEIFNDIEFRQATDYQDFDAASYDLEVRSHDSDNVAIPAPGVVFEAGNVYDIFAIGQTSDQSLALLTLVTPVSTACTEVLGIGTPEDACVRVMHASPGTPAIDVYANDSLVIENLAYGSATDFAALPEGDDRNIKIVPTGNTLEDAIIDAGIDLNAGEAVQIIAVNQVDEIEIMVEEVDLSPIPVDQVRVRVVHASTDAGGVDVSVTDGPTLFEGVDYRDTTDYTIIDAGTYDIQVTSGDDVAIRVTDLTVEAGMVYDLFAIGRVDDGTVALVSLAVPAEARAGSVGSPEAGESDSMVEEATAEALGTPEP